MVLCMASNEEVPCDIIFAELLRVSELCVCVCGGVGVWGSPKGPQSSLMSQSVTDHHVKLATDSLNQSTKNLTMAKHLVLGGPIFWNSDRYGHRFSGLHYLLLGYPMTQARVGLSVDHKG